MIYGKKLMFILGDREKKKLRDTIFKFLGDNEVRGFI